MKKNKKVWLNKRWYLDTTSIPYVLFDSQNKEFGELGYSCSHRSSGGFCDNCWEEFITAGLIRLNELKIKGD